MSGARIDSLIGRALDRQVHEAERMDASHRLAWEFFTGPPAYSTNPSFGQPLIERLGIASGRVAGTSHWWAVVPGCELGCVGPTQLIAGCRAFLVNLYGECLPS